MAKKKICGIVMPISECDNLSPSHWSDVRLIVERAATAAGYEARLVSDTFESNLIHKEILQNIYNDDLIIVDVSGRNPNVFFELGIRMATQKPTIIIKDGITPYPFDTGPNRYIEYPRDLRHPAMEKFTQQLVKSIEKTAKQSPESSFIGSLGPFKVPEIKQEGISADEAILDRLGNIERQLKHESSTSRRTSIDGAVFQVTPFKNGFNLSIRGIDEVQVENGIKDFCRMTLELDTKVSMRPTGPQKYDLTVSGKDAETDLVNILVDCIQDAIPF